MGAEVVRAREIILVYADEGVGPRSLWHTVHSLSKALGSLYRVRHVKAEELRQEGEWMKRASLLVVPGGADKPYHAALQGVGNANIRRFVEQGGAYLGICAGGYYGCERVEFEKCTWLEVAEERELRFFPGVARGAFYPGFNYLDESGSRAALIETADGAQVKIYYNGGCTFVPSTTPESTASWFELATYVQPKAPAIVGCSIGSGRVILSGVHPEHDASLLAKEEAGDTHLDVIVPELLKDEPQRQELFASLLRWLNLLPPIKANGNVTVSTGWKKG